MALISVSLDDEHASLELRERVTLPEAALAKVARALVSHRNIVSAVVTSTCLRTMVVVESDRFHGAIDEITETLSDVTGVAADELKGSLTLHFDRGVANHLFAVAAGLKSVVPGEFEILGQLRRSLDIALDEHTVTPSLQELFTRALASGRRVRHETGIARGTTSFAHAAVETAFEHLDLNGATSAVIVGAGQLATGIARSVAAHSSVETIIVCNRTAARAHELATQVADPRVQVQELGSLSSHVAHADVVFVAADVPAPVVTRDTIGDRTRSLVLVDLAVPRGVARDVEEHDGVRRLDIGTLQERVARAIDERRDAFADAEVLVREDVEKFLDDQRARGAAAIVAQLREHFDDVVEAEFLRRSSDLHELDDETRALVQSMVRSVVAKLAHRPMTALKEAAGTDQGLRLSEATRNLFELP